MLGSKSLVQLRGIAQSLDIPDVFQKDMVQLVQAIEIKQQSITPIPKIEIPKPELDARLMTKNPSKRTDQQEIEIILEPYTQRGLNVRFDQERWYMSFGKKNDQGTLRMPLRTVLFCANKVME